MSTVESTPELSPLLWRGAGAVGVYDRRAEERGGTPRSFCREEAMAWGAGGSCDAATSRIVERYFESGGRELWLEEAADAAASAGALLDSGYHGPSSSLHALAESEAVGVLALSTPAEPGLWQELDALAAERSDLLFVLQRPRAGRSGLQFLRRNVVEVDDAGALCAVLEASDFRPGARPLPPYDSPAAGRFEPDALLLLQTWRRLEGLRRSIDWGTRWLLFEVHHSRIWRRAEREVCGFLYSLGRAGLVDPLAPLEVHCRPLSTATRSPSERSSRTTVLRGLSGGPRSDEEPEEPGENAADDDVPSVRLEVQVALRQPYEGARRDLESLTSRDGSWPPAAPAPVSQSNRNEVVE